MLSLFPTKMALGSSFITSLIITSAVVSYINNSTATTNQPRPPDLIKSVRVDLSSLPQSANPDQLNQDIINQLITVGANTVFISPWADGYANYQSQIAPLNNFGQNSLLENFITKAHSANLKVFAWFVVGKDNFPSELHPEWYAKTINGQPYQQEDEPGLFLPFASLANQDYLSYHLALLREVNQLPLDGWVISEPLIGWGDRYDDYYTDFSPAALNKFQQQTSLDATTALDNPAVYSQWVDFRAQTVTDFVAASMNALREPEDSAARPIAITIFTEPDRQGKLSSFGQIREWLGTDIDALANLNPDYIEIQSLFLDFEHRQKPAWTASMIEQFRQQLKANIPLLVSIQGFDSQRKLRARRFTAAMSAAMSSDIAGVSFYAYHTLGQSHWQALTELWQ